MGWLKSSQFKDKDPQARIDALRKVEAGGDPRTIKEIRGLLSDPVPEVRIAAVNVISRWRDENGLKALGVAVRDADARVREAAALGLRVLAHPATIPHLTPLLRDGSAAVRSAAAQALDLLTWTPPTPGENALLLGAMGRYAQAGALGTPGIDVLLAYMGDQTSTVRRDVATALGAFPDARVAAALDRAVQDPDPAVRIAAIYSLSRMASLASPDSVARATSDPDKSVRAATLEALEHWNHPNTIPLFQQALRDESWVVRAAAARAFARSSDPSARDSLMSLLKDRDTDVRCAAAEALGLLGEEAIESLIVAHLDPESSVRQAAAKSLTRIDPRWHQTERAQRTMPLLKRVIRGDDYRARQHASDLLYKIFSIRPPGRLLTSTQDRSTRQRIHSVDILAAAAWDEDALVRAAAVQGLGSLGDRTMIDLLSARSRDTSQWVRAAAERAVRRLCGEAPEAGDFHLTAAPEGGLRAG